jgi:8-oxo-dGTP pyrophosphatase MutT (NUDIX family)
MINLPPEEYYKQLKKRHAGSGILFLDTHGKILVVKPTYKDGWLIPGGTIDEGEFPKKCAERETREEIGLDILTQRLLCVDYIVPRDTPYENIQFVFFGGILNEEIVRDIRIPKDELSEFRFVDVDEAMRILRPNLSRRLPYCLEAIKSGSIVYLENGENISISC